MGEGSFIDKVAFVGAREQDNNPPQGYGHWGRVAILVLNNAHPTITNCLFLANSIGVAIAAGDESVLVNNTFVSMPLVYGTATALAQDHWVGSHHHGLFS
jgi:parallel beta-helix repeat protein